MQSLILPPTPFAATPQFGLSRFNPDPERTPFNRPRSIHARGYSPRALPPPRLMASSVPGDDPLGISGHTRRPGPKELPQPLSSTTTTDSSGPLVASTLPAPSSTYEQSQPALTLHDEPSPRWPPPYAFQGIPQPSELSYPTVSLPPSSSPGIATRSPPQRPTRRTKAHVASACVNCKKKHLGCDSARPCRRCVLSGKASTCVDVTHKKRGRPPLKAEDASLRQYTTRLDHPAAPGDSQASQSSRRGLHKTSGSREIRPVTDLQTPGGQGLGMRTGPPHRWSTSVFPHSVDPSLAMPGNHGHRRLSSSGSLSSLATAPPGFVPMAGGGSLSPVFGSRMPPVMGRPPSSYANPSIQPQNTSSPPYQQFYSGSPYMNRQPMGESPVSRELQEPSTYLESPVKLPPIFPPMPSAGTTSPPGHRLSDPYPGNWSPRTREELLSQQRRPPPPAMPPAHATPGLMEPVSPHTQIHHNLSHQHPHPNPPAASDLSYSHAHHQPQPSLPRPPETVMPAAHQHSIHLPSSTYTTAHARDEPPSSGAEAEGGDGDGNRPAKRRKMALDDMVND